MIKVNRYDQVKHFDPDVWLVNINSNCGDTFLNTYLTTRVCARDDLIKGKLQKSLSVKCQSVMYIVYILHIEQVKPY